MWTIIYHTLYPKFPINAFIQWYVDSETEGVVQLFDTLPSTGNDIREGCALVLMQEQDSLRELLINRTILCQVSRFFL